MDYKHTEVKFALLSLNQASGADTGLDVLIGVTVAVILFCLVFGLAQFITDFSGELRYLNMEIRRTEGEERRHYIHQRRRLWLSLLPFMRY